MGKRKCNPLSFPSPRVLQYPLLVEVVKAQTQLVRLVKVVKQLFPLVRLVEVVK